MNLSTLQPAMGSKTDSFRKGRGHGSGNGKTAAYRSFRYYQRLYTRNNNQH